MKPTHDTVLLAHGSGGRLTHELITQLFMKRFSNPVLNALDDAAALKLSPAQELAFTTDSFVVDPVVFPGGDIGKLAVCGTVNDLAMKGARPLALSLAAIIEEGVSIKLLERITDSAMRAAKEAGVRIVTGDTKVVERGKADKMFLTSSGVGIIPKGIKLSAPNARHGDAVIINGTIGDHGIAVMAARNDFKFTTKISSDCAPLNHLAAAMLKRSPSIHVMRDPTRGGVATTLVEIATASNTGIIIDEASLPVRPQVRAACSILGLDPLYVANEGKLLAVLPEKHAATVLKTMKNDPYGKASAVIGKVVKSPKGVWLKTTAGGLRPIAMLEGAQLPRIC